MKKDDFLIRKSTGVVFQVNQVGENVEIVRLMDFQPYVNNKNIIETEFDIIHYGHTSWNALFEYKNKLLLKQESNIVKINKDNKIELYPIHFLNEPIFNKMAQDLKAMTLKAFRPKVNEEVKENVVVDKKKNKLKLIKNEDEKTDNNDLEESLDNEEIKFLIINPDPKDSLDSIVLHPETKKALDLALIKMEFKNILQKDWAPSVMNKKVSNNCCLNFYGPPGTGKTVSVKALASILQKPIVQVDFSELLSKWVGGTGKNIKKYFDKAKELDAILFFDEADTLLHSRANAGSGSEQHNIQNQNIFMQELDRYDGVLVTTTNHFENYDEAQVRRFSHIEFLLPTLEMRKVIIENHLPLNLKFADDCSPEIIAQETEGFSGADLSNLIEQTLLNKIVTVKQDNIHKKTAEISLIIKNSLFSLSTFKEEIAKINNAKNNFKGKFKQTGLIKLV